MTGSRSTDPAKPGVLFVSRWFLFTRLLDNTISNGDLYKLQQNLEFGLFSKSFALPSPLSRPDALAVCHDRGNWHRSCFTLSRQDQRRAELMIDSFGDRVSLLQSFL
jgi:hypothetical protein